MPPKNRKPPAATPAGNDEPFEFESSAGVIKVPSLSSAKPPKGLEMLEMQAISDPVVREARLMIVMLQRTAGPAAMRIIGQLDVDEMEEFMVAWAEHSGSSLGE